MAIRFTTPSSSLERYKAWPADVEMDIVSVCGVFVGECSLRGRVIGVQMVSRGACFGVLLRISCHADADVDRSLLRARLSCRLNAPITGHAHDIDINALFPRPPTSKFSRIGNGSTPVAALSLLDATVLIDFCSSTHPACCLFRRVEHRSKRSLLHPLPHWRRHRRERQGADEVC